MSITWATEADREEFERLVRGATVKEIRHPDVWDGLMSEVQETEVLARALFAYDHCTEAAEIGEAWAGPWQDGLRMAREDYDERTDRVLGVMWSKTKTDAAADALNRAAWVLDRMRRT